MAVFMVVVACSFVGGYQSLEELITIVFRLNGGRYNNLGVNYRRLQI
jgi:hypothetical protein